jgi:hypothetical protein
MKYTVDTSPPASIFQSGQQSRYDLKSQLQGNCTASGRTAGGTIMNALRRDVSKLEILNLSSTLGHRTISGSQKATTRNQDICNPPHPFRRLPLLIPRPWLTLIPNDRMEFKLDRILCIIATVSLTPIVAHGIRKDIARTTECGRSDTSTNLWVAFEPVLGVLVPEVEGAVGASGAEGAVDGVEGYGVYGVDFCDVALGRVGLAVAFEGEV